MRLIHDEEQTALAEMVRQVVRDRSPVSRLRALRAEDAGWSRALWAELAELGLVGAALPEAHGGMGLGFFDLCVVLEGMGRNLAPEPFVSTVLLGAQALLLGADEGARATWLPKIAAGEAIVSLAHSDARGAAVVLDGDVLRGTKRDVLDGRSADLMLVSAGAEVFVVDAADCAIEPLRRIDGRDAATVRLDGVAVRGRLGPVLDAVLDRATVGLCAEMLGGAQQVFEDTLAYLKTREQFGATLGSFQVLQHRAARLFAELALSRSAVLAAARTVDEAPERVALMASLAKATLTDTYLHVANEAVQMHGGIGMTDECDVGFYLKRARVCEATFGNAAHHRRRWAALSGY